MKLIRIIYRLRTWRFFWAALFIAILAANGLLLAAHISRNRNQLVFNPYVKAVLPVYREVRGLTNSIIDLAYVFSMKRDVGIPQYYLEIKSSDLRKLNEALPSSLANDVIAGTAILSDDADSAVSGKFYYDNKTYEVKVRYRGLNANHWTRPKKSWQIKFDKDTPFNGLRTLKLIIPEDRGYFAEMLNNYRAQKLGLFFPQAELAQLYVNNDYHGVYFSVEDFSAEMLEKNQKPADANIYVTDEPIVSGQAFDSIEHWRKQAGDALFGYANFSELDFLLTQLNKPDFAKVAENIIDMDSFYNWNIVAILAGSYHQGDRGNMRLYFNNAKGKFEFIPWDVEIKSNLPTQLSSTVTENILSNPKFYMQRNQKLWDYIKDDNNLADDLRYYDGLDEKLKGVFYSDFKKHDNNLTFNRTVADIRNQYVALFNRLKDLFAADRVELTVRREADDKLITLSFNIDSLAGINLDSVKLPAGAQLTAEARQYLFNPNESVAVRYSGTIDDISKIEFRLSNAITGEPVEVDSIKFADLSTFALFSGISATTDEFIQKHPQFKKQGNAIVLLPGAYSFTRDVIVPKNTTVRIEPGVSIALGPGVSFVSYSPVAARGTSGRPIVLRPLNPQEPWGSFAILNNGAKKSTLEYVDASGGSSDYINGVFLSGMVSVYYSDAVLSHATIAESHSDDGVNLKYANIEVANSLFKNNSADGLDLDYDSGVVRDSIFTNNGNDGIDLSGSKIVIKNNRIQGSGDKCISIGENTIDTVVFNTIMDGCHIGVQAKDNSRPVIINSVIINNDIGIDAYQKKAIYITGGHPTVYNSIIRDNKEQIKQDEFSDIKISFSNVSVQTGGKNNFDEKKNYLDIQDRGRGNTEILKQYLNIDTNQAPVGLWEAF